MTYAQKQQRHDRACRMVGYALTLGADGSAWCDLSTVLRCRLTAFERACLLGSVVGSMAIDDVHYVIDAMCPAGRVGMPLPPLMDPMEEATWWTSVAPLEDRKAVLAATLLSLPARGQDAFLVSARRRIAA